MASGPPSSPWSQSVHSPAASDTTAVARASGTGSRCCAGISQPRSPGAGARTTMVVSGEGRRRGPRSRRSALGVGVPPGDEVPQRTQVVARAAHTDGEQPRADVEQRLRAGCVVGDVLRKPPRLGGDPGGALDLSGVATDLAAPLVEHRVLVGDGARVAEAVPDARVLRDDLERLPL